MNKIITQTTTLYIIALILFAITLTIAINEKPNTTQTPQKINLPTTTYGSIDIIQLQIEQAKQRPTLLRIKS